MNELKDLLKVPFRWSGENKIKLNNSGKKYLQLHNSNYLMNANFLNFICTALNTEFQRQFGEERWKIIEDEFECPKCGASYVIFDDIKWELKNYCPSCGIRLLPPEDEEKLPCGCVVGKRICIYCHPEKWGAKEKQDESDI